MKKLIYEGYDNTFYNESKFPGFMNTWVGADLVSSLKLAPTQYSGGKVGAALVYHLQLQEVTLVFKAVTTERIMGNETVRQTSVTASGRGIQVGEVEKIVLDAEKSFAERRT